MPTPLNPIDLSTAVVNTTGKIDLSPCAPTSNPAYTNTTAILQIYNESACGLRLTGKTTGLAFDLPAGGWNNIAIPTGETEIDYVVLYVMQGALVNTLLATYYAPNESVPRAASVGNSPIGGALSQATQVIQTGQAAPNPVLQGTPQATISAAIQKSLINNDGSSFLGNTSVLGAAFSTDANGNTSGHSFLLAHGAQETGYCGASFEVGGSVASAVGPTVNFKTVMTNVPSSITLNTPIENSGASSPGATDINIYGFWLAWTATAINSLSRYTNTYTTVGN